MHVAPFAMAACCAGVLQAGIATAPADPPAIEKWAVETVKREFGYHSADAEATAPQGGHLAGDGWAALGNLRQEFEKARKAGILVVARPQIHKTGEAPEQWRVDVPVYIWGCFNLASRENVAPREDVINDCPNGEVRANHTTLGLNVLRSPADTEQDFILERMVAQP